MRSQRWLQRRKRMKSKQSLFRRFLSLTYSVSQPKNSDDTLSAIKAMMEMFKKKSEQREAALRKKILQLTATRGSHRRLNVMDLPSCSDVNPWRPAEYMPITNGRPPPFALKVGGQVEILLDVPREEEGLREHAVKEANPPGTRSNEMLPKDSDKLRVTLDLSPLNKFIENDKLKMLTLQHIRALLPKRAYTVFIDIADAYWHIPINRQLSSYLRFRLQKRKYAFRTMPFGQNSPKDHHGTCRSSRSTTTTTRCPSGILS
ncbi:uncharacterized protein [Palaemon carinicauda]|uniref:uncharacterized protein n=1 Tax=Palaemon carinicauda TaxID=392227 RepID=UPI0035B5EA8C